MQGWAPQSCVCTVRTTSTFRSAPRDTCSSIYGGRSSAGRCSSGSRACCVPWSIPAIGLAHLTYYILARAALQLLGFMGVFGVAFRARQRFDFQQFLNLTAMLSVPLLQITLILLLRPWGEVTTEIGPGLGGALGLAGGVVLANLFTFVLGRSSLPPRWPEYWGAVPAHVRCPDVQRHAVVWDPVGNWCGDSSYRRTASDPCAGLTADAPESAGRELAPPIAPRRGVRNSAHRPLS